MIDFSINTIVGDIPTLGVSYHIVIKPGTRRAFVSCELCSAVLVVDFDQRTVVKQVPLGSGQCPISVNAAGTRAYIAVDDHVRVIEAANETLMPDVIPMGVLI